MSLIAQTAICDLLKQLTKRLSKNNFHIILSAEKTVLLKFSKYVPPLIGSAFIHLCYTAAQNFRKIARKMLITTPPRDL